MPIRTDSDSDAARPGSLAGASSPATRSHMPDSRQHLDVGRNLSVVRAIVAAISMLRCACVGGRAFPLDAASEVTRVRAGHIIACFDWRSARFHLESPRCFWGSSLSLLGRQAGAADTALPRLGFSVFGTIHPDIFRVRAPRGSKAPVDRIRLASLEPQFGFAAAAKTRGMLTHTSASACRNASLDERFAALELWMIVSRLPLPMIVRRIAYEWQAWKSTSDGTFQPNGGTC